MNISVSIDRSDELQAMIDKAGGFPMRVLEACARALSASGHIIIGNAVKYRFVAATGPFPIAEHKLGRVSGRLRQSLTVTRPQIHQGESAVSMGFGSNVRYFMIHEFGFAGEVNVKAHQRKGRPVRAHTRAVRIAAREPMQTELKDARTDRILSEQIARQVSLAIDDLERGAP